MKKQAHWSAAIKYQINFIPPLYVVNRQLKLPIVLKYNNGMGRSGIRDKFHEQE